MEPKKLIGRRIRELRRSLGLSQEEVAARADIAAKHLSSIELGKENPTLDTFIGLARALDVELWELLNYGHELTGKELQRRINQLAKQASEADARLFLKILNSITK